MKQIFKKWNLGTLSLNNRMIRSATMEFGKLDDCNITERYHSLYESLAKGGAGLLITGAMSVNPDSQAKRDMVSIYADEFYKSFLKTVQIVHKYNVPIAAQIAHAGLIAMESYSGKRIGPSAELGGEEMTVSDIHAVINDFSKAALKAKQAGADAVQIHAGHGFLISQFLSPAFNKRADDYGGTIENRSRILFEIIDNIKFKIGDDFPILVKLNYSDLIDNGLSFEDSKWICKKLDSKNITAIEISSGLIPDPAHSPSKILRKKEDEAYNLKAASEIADLIHTPIICVGGFRSMASMETVLNESNISAISLCRPLICEPDLPNKWQADASYKPKCVSCNGCLESPVLGCLVIKE